MKSKIIISVAIICGFTYANAQQMPGVDKRQQRQEQRIVNGVQKGQLTAKETAHLEKRHQNIANAEERAKADGKITLNEKENLQKRQNSLSKDIQDKRHNGHRD